MFTISVSCLFSKPSYNALIIRNILYYEQSDSSNICPKLGQDDDQGLTDKVGCFWDEILCDKESVI